MKKTFTTTALLTAWFMLMSSLGIIASVPSHVQKSATDIVRREIIRRIACPEFVTQETEVKAIVQVDENGTVKVDEINAETEQLRDYMLNQLQNLKVKSAAPAQKFVLVI